MERLLTVSEARRAVAESECISYLVDREGAIAAVSERPWREFAHANGGDAIADPVSVVGRDLSGFISGEQVRTQLKTLIGRAEQSDSEVSFPFRCDAPAVVRRMRLSLQRVVDEDGRPAGILFRSEAVRDSVRELHDLIMTPQPPDRSDDPLQIICSYCKRLEYPAGSRRWLDVEEFEASTPRRRFRLSHGACEDCTEVVLGALERKAER